MRHLNLINAFWREFSVRDYYFCPDMKGGDKVNIKHEKKKYAFHFHKTLFIFLLLTSAAQNCT